MLLFKLIIILVKIAVVSITHMISKDYNTRLAGYLASIRGTVNEVETLLWANVPAQGAST